VRIAFYAPLKPPHDPVPSGDRRVARLLIDALGVAGHEVELASVFRSRDSVGDEARQRRLRDLGGRLGERLVRRYRARPTAMRPAAWMTYHLYYKAPDWLGGLVADALGIPYIVVEGSHAPKRSDGPWDLGHQATARAIARADAVIALNRDDMACVRPLIADPARLQAMPPFLDADPYAKAAARRLDSRARIAAAHGLDGAVAWVLAVAMMRDGDKLSSYQLLARALATLAVRPWRLLVVGDGPAREQVEAAFSTLDPGRAVFLGALPGNQLPDLYAAADLMAWPAAGEAFGMAILEAQATGLPVVAGRVRGVPDIVRDGETGILTPPGDVAAFAAAVGALLSHDDRRRAMGEAAMARVRAGHGLPAAAAGLDRLLRRLTAARP
jgi:glycosyltransferase involved in cell wall biosynthesis